MIRRHLAGRLAAIVVGVVNAVHMAIFGVVRHCLADVYVRPESARCNDLSNRNATDCGVPRFCLGTPQSVTM
jgi:hypothetical protein